LNPTTGITHGTNEKVGVNVTVTPTSGTATGDVALMAKFADGTTQGLDQFTLSGGKVTNGTTNNLPGSPNGQPYQVYAHYTGDGTNAPSDSASVPVTVAPENSQTFIVVPSFDSNGSLVSGNARLVSYGSRYILRMYVTDQNAVANPAGAPTGTCDQVNVLTCPTGTVTLTDNGTAVDSGGGGAGIYNLNIAGYTRDIAPSLTGGTHTLTASYSGDNSYQKSVSATLNFTVTPATLSISQQLGSSPIVGVAFPASVTGSSQAISGVAPTGTVSFDDGSTQLGGPVTINGWPAGNNPIFFAGANLTIASAGSHTITASYSGDSNYSAATASTTVNILNPTTSNLTVSPSTVNYGNAVTVSGVVDTTVPASNSALKPTGNVALNGSYDGPITNGVTINTVAGSTGNWEIQLSATVTPRNSENFTLLYTGDTNYAGATAASSFVTVNIPDFSLGPTSGISIIPAAGQPGSGQITVTPLSAIPSSVNLQLTAPFISGYTITLNPLQVNLNGAATVTTLSMTPAAGVHSTVMSSKTKQAGFVGSGSTKLWQLALVLFGALLLAATAATGRRLRWVFGVSALAVTLMSFGCGGGGGGGGGGGSGLAVTTISLTTSNAKVGENVPFLITATVTSTKPVTGTVTFYDFGTAIAAPIAVANGQAQAGSAYINTPGVYNITASYSGDSNNLPSTTNTPLTQVITGTMPFTITGNTGSNSHSLQGTIGVQ
jgi:hypothetical protein